MCCCFTLWAIKKRDTFIFVITLADIDRFIVVYSSEKITKISQYLSELSKK